MECCLYDAHMCGMRQEQDPFTCLRMQMPWRDALRARVCALGVPRCTLARADASVHARVSMGVVGVKSTAGRAVKCVDPSKTTRSESA